MRPHANRTYLFTPGNHARRVEKALQLNADVVILDLEDAVAVAEKVATRTIIKETLALPKRCAVYVRVNSYDTEFCYGDLSGVFGKNLDGIVLPKLESVTDLKSVDSIITDLEHEHGLEPGSVDLMPIIETAKGAAAVRDIAQADSRVKRLSLGGGDYTRDLGIEWTHDELALLPVRSEMVLASRLGELEPPIDTVFLHIKEHDAYRESCIRAHGLGFQGKLCIHPDQVDPTNDVFTPTDEVVTWSRKIVAEFEKAEKDGVASIQVDGYFVDYPIVEKAQRALNIIDVLKSLGKA
ncbi:MAG: CoA ester lyase [Rhodospirillaceae bacterium]|nr:CoA ester lyase [Rhodospirillaceae bacterium]